MSHVSSILPAAAATESSVLDLAIASVAPVKADKSLNVMRLTMEKVTDITVDSAYNVRTFNPATDKDDKWLANDIAAVGVTRPLVCQRIAGVIVLRQGHRRLAAAAAAGIKKVMVEWMDNTPDALALIYDMHRSNTGKALTALQLGDLCAKARAAGDSATEVAHQLGFTSRYVSNLLIMAGSPDDIRTAMVAGRIAGTCVYETVQKVTAGDTVKGYALLSAVLASVGPDGKVTAKVIAEYLAQQAGASSDGGEGEGGSEGAAHKAVYTTSKRSLFRDNVLCAVATTEADATALALALNA